MLLNLACEIDPLFPKSEGGYDWRVNHGNSDDQFYVLMQSSANNHVTTQAKGGAAANVEKFAGDN